VYTTSSTLDAKTPVMQRSDRVAPTSNSGGNAGLESQYY
jgi:hypothetical protein